MIESTYIVEIVSENRSNISNIIEPTCNLNTMGYHLFESKLHVDTLNIIVLMAWFLVPVNCKCRVTNEINEIYGKFRYTDQTKTRKSIQNINTQLVL